jgi:hypothetical protein
MVQLLRDQIYSNKQQGSTSRNKNECVQLYVQHNENIE